MLLMKSEGNSQFFMTHATYFITHPHASHTPSLRVGGLDSQSQALHSLIDDSVIVHACERDIPGNVTRLQAAVWEVSKQLWSMA